MIQQKAENGLRTFENLFIVGKFFVISNKTSNVDLRVYRNTTAVSENYLFLAEQCF